MPLECNPDAKANQVAYFLYQRFQSQGREKTLEELSNEDIYHLLFEYRSTLDLPISPMGVSEEQQIVFQHYWMNISEFIALVQTNLAEIREKEDNHG